MADEDPFGFRPEDDTQQGIKDLISQFASPEIANFLSIIIKSSMGDVFNNTTSGGGITGPGALFGGPRNIGDDMMNTFNRRSMELSMTGSQQALERSVFDQKVAAHVALGKDQGMAEKAASEFGLVNVVTSMMMSSRQPEQLQAGLIMGGGYMGARSIFGMSAEGADIQQGINDRVAGLSTAVSENFMDPANINDYYGLSGGDVGRLYAEMGRTGGFNGMNNQQAIQALQQNAGAVSAGSQFFQGGPMDITDQTNALLGVNAINTFGGASVAGMFRGMNSVGRAPGVGLLSDQMMSLAMMSSQVSMGMGSFYSAGAMSNAAEAGIVLGGAMSAGGRFVNERRLREGIVARVTGAGESDMAKMISGAYSTMDVDSREAFLTEIRGSDVTTLSGVGDIARRHGAGGSDMSLLDIGETLDARVFRAEGIGVQTATTAQMKMASDYRRDVLRSIGRGDIANQIEGPLTMEKMEAAFGDTINGRASAGRVGKLFEQESRALYGMGATEVDAMMTGAERSPATRALREHIKARSTMDLTMAKYGKTSGIQGLLGFASMVSDKGGKASFEGLLGSILGLTDTNMGEMMEGLDPETFGGKATEFYESITDTEQMAGLDVMGNAMLTGKLGGENLTKEKRKQFIRMMSGTMDKEEAGGILTNLAGEYGDTKIRKEIAMVHAQNAFVGRDTQSKGLQDEIKEYAMLEQFLKVTEKGSFIEKAGGGLTEGNVQNAQIVASKIQTFLTEEGEKGQDILNDAGVVGTVAGITKEQFSNYTRVKSAAAKQDELMQSFEPATDILSSIFTLLQEMFTAFQGGGKDGIGKAAMEAGRGGT